MDRRAFLLTTAALPLYAAGELQTFTPAEAKIVEALCAQIIPADEYPGAKEAGVLYYIDRQLAGPLARYAGAYKSGLPEFAALVDMPAAGQLAFLKTKESGAFFQLVVEHTMQGFYGSPEHGGNKNEASWKMLGIVDVMAGHDGSHKH
jgi:gluconate 2-dehydrogenase gamma chain